MINKVYESITIFDGDCVFCNRWAKYIIKNDRSKNIYVTASSSVIAKNIISEIKIETSPKNTILFISGNKHYAYSTAVLKIAMKMKGYHSLLIVGFMIPKFLRDYVYKQLAKKRNSLSKDHCVINEYFNHHPRYIK